MGAPEIGANSGHPVRVRVRSQHHVDIARHVARVVSLDAGFDEVTTARLATAVSELAANLCFHAPGGGVISFLVIARDGRTGVTIVAEDDGPGIADLARAMQDGFSTRGGMGSGLPSVQRLMDEFEIASEPRVGTRVRATLWRRQSRSRGRPA